MNDSAMARFRRALADSDYLLGSAAFTVAVALLIGWDEGDMAYALRAGLVLAIIWVFPPILWAWLRRNQYPAQPARSTGE